MEGKIIKAVIFDMDGVLIDAKEWHYEALNRALRLFGFEIARYAHLTSYDGLPTRKKLEMLTIEQGLPPALHAFINQMKQQYTMEMIYTHCKPLFAHEYALSRLKTRGLRLACCSNSIRATVDAMLDQASLSRYFEFTLSNEDVSKPKPDPEMYLKAIRRLGLPPDECLVVEDNENGVTAAQRAGAHVMVVRDTNDVTLENIVKHLKEEPR